MFSSQEVERFARELIAIFVASRAGVESRMPSQALLWKFGATRIREFQAGLREAHDRKWMESERNFVWITEGGAAAAD